MPDGVFTEDGSAGFGLEDDGLGGSCRVGLGDVQEEEESRDESNCGSHGLGPVVCPNGPLEAHPTLPHADVLSGGGM